MWLTLQACCTEGNTVFVGEVARTLELVAERDGVGGDAGDGGEGEGEEKEPDVERYVTKEGSGPDPHRVGTEDLEASGPSLVSS